MTEENRTGISFSMKRGRVLIYRCTLRSLGVPKNIRFLLNVKKKRIAVQVCEAIDRDSFKVPEFEKGGNDQYEISSKSFLKMVYRIAGWNAEGTYRITGEVYPGNRLVEFAFGDAVAIADEDLWIRRCEKL